MENSDTENNNSLSANDLRAWLPEVCRIAYQAGQLIAQYYRQQDVEINQKADGTPVTQADLDADALICDALKKLSPDIPIVSEESVANIPFAQRKPWQTFWLVDPLDGTKEFIERTGEYSVNIALVHQGKPLLGVVYGPELGDIYFACQAAGLPDGESGIGEPEIIQSMNKRLRNRVGKLSNLWPQKMQPEVIDWSKQIQMSQRVCVARNPQKIIGQRAFRVAVSRRHGSTLQRFMSQLGVSQTVKMGSALKACLVAEGAVDVYPRFGPTSLWDTAASQCIVEAAGGEVLNAAGHPLEYVQTESLLNPFFIAVSHRDFDWPAFPEVL